MGRLMALMGRRLLRAAASSPDEAEGVIDSPAPGGPAANLRRYTIPGISERSSWDEPMRCSSFLLK